MHDGGNEKRRISMRIQTTLRSSLRLTLRKRDKHGASSVGLFKQIEHTNECDA
jgi:hypothetical protein